MGRKGILYVYLIIMQSECAVFEDMEHLHFDMTNMSRRNIWRTTDNGQAAGKLYHLRLRVECTLFVIYKAHDVLVIGLYELLCNPTI